MSSIGEGIDFSQEQRKISGIVPRGTQPLRPLPHSPGFSLTRKTFGGERGQTLISYSSDSYIQRADRAVIVGAMIPFI